MTSGMLDREVRAPQAAAFLSALSVEVSAVFVPNAGCV
jgi:hypothetical protein